MVLQAERRKLIIKEVKRNEVVKVDLLAEMLGVSEMTVRRDLSSLEKDGLIKRTHGGATLVDSLTQEVPYMSKEVLNIDVKERIALEAVKYVEKDMVIALDGGTTAMEVAKLMAEDSSLTVITPDVMIASYLSKHSKMDIICTGGYVQNKIGICLGNIAEGVLKKVRTDISFIGTSGFTSQAITTPTLDKEGLKRRLIESAKKPILLTDSSKYGREGFIKIADMEEFDLMISDDRMDVELAESLREKLDLILV